MPEPTTATEPVTPDNYEATDFAPAEVLFEKEYIGTKRLRAEPMTRGGYNLFRGWDIPEGEDPTDEGYIVMYEDGYISWSPKRVFEAAYRPADTWLDRLKVEHEQLRERLNALVLFMQSDAFGALAWIEKEALQRQKSAMSKYEAILQERLDRAKQA